MTDKDEDKWQAAHRLTMYRHECALRALALSDAGASEEEIAAFLAECEAERKKGQREGESDD